MLFDVDKLIIFDNNSKIEYGLLNTNVVLKQLIKLHLQINVMLFMIEKKKKTKTYYKLMYTYTLMLIEMIDTVTLYVFYETLLLTFAKVQLMLIKNLIFENKLKINFTYNIKNYYI